MIHHIHSAPALVTNIFKLTKLTHKPQGSLRLGISLDCTLAYLDILFDEEELGENSVFRPLGPIGQARLPLVFRLAGLGTYFSPWFLDTNDTLLQVSWLAS